MTEHRLSNRLGTETSPYLLQHAHNPVDWYPWGEEALGRARAEDKPLFVSIGYAACHWCHVMERESFEDEETATLLNERFVPIKVDREERPDLDAIYMDAAQALTGHGGWPLSAFCAPDGTPFFVGTYFPPEDRPGMPSFRRVLVGIAEAWRERRDEMLGQGRRVLDAISRTAALEGSGDPLSEDTLRAAHARLRQAFDAEWGGFGGAPKFPQPMTLEFLLRCHVRGYPESLAMVERTLDRMAAGGLRDHVGGGFARYSTDERWHVPHFEKMLYDNAQLARLYLHVWQATAEDRHRRVAEETLDYLLRELQHAEGGFFSSQDADSEGVEGRFFVWSYEELVERVGEHVAAFFGAVPGGNWEGTNVLWTPLPIEQVAYELSVPEDELARDVQDARARLFEARERRVRPGTDDKILSGWNGLAISALANAGRALGRADYRNEAVRAAEFVLTHLRDDRRRLLRSWRNGRAGRPGFADDYALLASACLDLYEATFDLRWFREARELAEELVRLFHDAERGGFFQTGEDAEELVVRPKELLDNAVPSANSAAAEVLQRLAHLTGEVDLERAGVSALGLVRDHLGAAPTGFGHALSAFDLYLGPTREVALVGDPEGEDMHALLDVLRSGYRPNVLLALASSHEPEAREEIALLAERTQLDGGATAYVCERFACKLPVSEPTALAEQLDG